ncbi:hypothetical protein EBN88_07425 [Streptomyces triticirhizae]|uniref:Uncharacterized protein n=1 Tax=Streptomyces triticirhizae TaxID=2483353 RepID=A0A3M2M177_9ACTN|nr:hypothetical protein EBN88_07425 [Streptomyces triticirhizae]
MIRRRRRPGAGCRSWRPAGAPGTGPAAAARRCGFPRRPIRPAPRTRRPPAAWVLGVPRRPRRRSPPGTRPRSTP